MTLVMLYWNDDTWTVFNEDLEVLIEGRLSHPATGYSDFKDDAYTEGVRIGAAIYHNPRENISVCKVVIDDA